MIVDFDDFCQTEHRLDLLETLREANPLFRCTLFAIPGRGSEAFWASVPLWCELAVHGWAHPNPYESARWTYWQAYAVLNLAPRQFVGGFKAPGWQISDGCYEAAQNLGYWVADHWDNDDRRPDGIRAHVISREAGAGVDPNHWHGHIGNVCGNGIQETFPELLARVRAASSFEWVSESVAPWRAKVPA